MGACRCSLMRRVRIYPDVQGTRELATDREGSAPIVDDKFSPLILDDKFSPLILNGNHPVGTDSSAV